MAAEFLFIFGLGFSGRAIATAALARGWRVEGSVRPGHQDGESPVPLHAFDAAHPLEASVLAGVTHVIGSIPPGTAGDPSLSWLVTHGPFPALRWVGYLSTTGVYGDHGGAWVDESAALKAASPRSVNRIAAEHAWAASGLPVQVFRLAGIYGLGRSPLDSVRQGTAHRVVKPGQVFGRIHVEDIARVVMASMDRPNSGAVYNVVDDEPAAPQDVVAHAAALLGVPPPPLVSWDRAKEVLSPMALSFYDESKRVANGRIKTELGVELAYPTYREGLKALLSS